MLSSHLYLHRKFLLTWAIICFPGSGTKEEAMLSSSMVEKKGEFLKFVNMLSSAGIVFSPN